MRLFVGLGNPGARYAANRHNIGFMALDRIAADHGFAAFRSRFQGQFTEGRLGDERIALLKPGTFMNLSGQSVGEAMRYLKLSPADLVVFHDELDLAPFKVRLKTGGGHAGHNGLRSLHAHIGDDYARVRLGIGHPGHKDRVADYVLGDFPKDAAAGLADLLTGLSEGAVALAAGDGAAFLNAVARRTTPPRPSTGSKGPDGQPRTANPRPSTPPATDSGASPRPEPGPPPDQALAPAATADPGHGPDHGPGGLFHRLTERFRR